jgi:hypothetical protein
LAAFDATGALLDSWRPGVSAVPGSPLVRALAASGNTVYVGGGFDAVIDADARSHPHHGLAAIDASGTPIDQVDPSPTSSSGEAQVLALAPLGSTLYVGGRFDKIGGQNRSNLAALDSASGNATGWDPGADGNVYAILPDCGAVYVGGGFTHAAKRERDYVAAIDPASGQATAWDPVAGGAVHALARSGSTLYVGGSFATIGGQLRQRLAALDLTTGGATAFDPGITGTMVRTIAATDSVVYAGGIFTSVGDRNRSNVAALDPTNAMALSWNPGADNEVWALTAAADSVYVAGAFRSVAGFEQQGFAPFTGASSQPAAPASCESTPALSKTPTPTTDSAPTAQLPSSTSLRSANAAMSVVARLAVHPARVRVGGRRLTITFVASRSTLVRLRFERLVAMRCRSSARLRPRRPACRGYRWFSDVTGRANAGVNRLDFPRQRVGRRTLAPGRYRVTVTPLPSYGGTPPARAYLTVAGRARR